MSGDRRRTRSSGRISALEQARELFVLWGALSQEGDVVDADALTRRLGVSKTEAERLIELVVTSKGNEDDFLSLYSPDDEAHAIGVAPGGNTAGRPLKLTDAEYAALSTALDALGLAGDDPLRAKVASLHDGALPDVGEVSNRITAMRTSTSYNSIQTCAQALVDGECLTFKYQGSNDSQPFQRQVIPKSLTLRDGSWLLEAYDLSREGLRCFRIDRMSSIRSEEQAPARAPQLQVRASRGTRTVSLRFSDLSFLELFDWPGLEVQRRNNTSVDGTIPYYDGSSRWLERRIAACRGAVTTDDEVLNQRVDKYIRSLLQDEDDPRPSSSVSTCQ